MRAQRVVGRQVVVFSAQYEETVLRLVQTQVMGLRFVVVYPNPAVVDVGAAVVVDVGTAAVVVVVAAVVVVVVVAAAVVVVVVVIAVVGENPAQLKF